MSALVASTLHRVLAGDPVEADDVRRLAREESREGIQHDFKSGKVFDEAKGKKRLVWDVASFANADGGLLVIGVGEEREGGRKEGPRLFEPVPVSVQVDERLGDLLRPCSPLLRPPPRWQTVEVDGGRVVLLGVPRSEQLVAAPDPDRGEPGYPLRFGDGTHRCPEYLVSDLRLGRRERPEFLLEPVTAKLDAERRIPYLASLDVRLQLVNVGLTWIDESILFIIGPGREGEAESVPPHFRAAVDAPQRGHGLWFGSVTLNAQEKTRVPPLGFLRSRFQVAAPFHSLDTTFLHHGDALMWTSGGAGSASEARIHAIWRFELRAGLCVVARGGAPRWFQLTATYFSTCAVGEVQIVPADGRPVVSFLTRTYGS